MPKNEDRHKTVNLFNMVAIFIFNYCINLPLKRFTYLQNKIFKHFIPFLLNSNLKRSHIWMRRCICFLKRSIYRNQEDCGLGIMEAIKKH